MSEGRKKRSKKGGRYEEVLLSDDTPAPSPTHSDAAVVSRADGGGSYATLGDEDASADGLREAEEAVAEAGKGAESTPESRAGVLSVLTFSWLDPIMKLGFKRQLQPDDLWAVREQDSGRACSVALERELRRQARKRAEAPASEPVSATRALLNAIRLSFGGLYAYAAVLKLAFDLMSFVNPLLLEAVIEYLRSTSDEPDARGYLYVFAFFANGIVSSLCLAQYFHSCFRTGMHVRAGLVSAVYQKSLRISMAGKQEHGGGNVISLMSTDCTRMQDLAAYGMILWSGPLVIAVTMFLLWQQLGAASLVGLVTMIAFMLPVNLILSRRVKLVQEDLMKVKDRRIGLTSEVLAQFKAIKMYAWEPSFGGRVEEARNDELGWLKRYIRLNVLMSVAWRTLPSLVALATFAAYTSSNELTVSRAFVSISLFNMLRFPLSMFPRVVSSVVEAGVSLRRLAEFLDAPEVSPPAAPELGPEEARDAAVVVRNGTFFWDDPAPADQRRRAATALRNVNLSVRRGQLVMVVGPTGAGKSAMLSAISGELASDDRTRSAVYGSVSLAPQLAWIQGATLRDNVLFGQPMDRAWYARVLTACALDADIRILPGGDLTEIGAKGVTLSGGQKQRVGLARAVYARHDVVLLDDVMAAVDAHVGNHIFRQCVQGLLADRTVVMVTHSQHLLSHADTVVVVDSGAVVAQGTLDEVRAAGIDPSLFGDHSPSASASPSPSPSPSPPPAAAEEAGGAPGEERKDGGGDQDEEVIDVPEQVDPSAGSRQQQTDEASRTAAGRLTEVEKRSEGSVSWSVYRAYLDAAGGVAVAAGVVFALAVMVGFKIATQFWLASWSSEGHGEHSPSGADNEHRLQVYAGLVAGDTLFSTLSLVLLMVGGYAGSRFFHSRLLQAVLRVPLYVLDVTPVGQFVNRFSKDMYAVDETIPQTISSYLLTMARLFEVVAVIAYVTPAFLVAVFPLALFYRYTQKYYIGANREMKRLDSTMRSPIYQHFAETMDGVEVVRAFGAQSRCRGESFSHLDRQLRAYYASVSSNRWLSTRLELVGTVIVTATALLAVMSRGSADPGMSALSLSYSLSITQTLAWAVRMTSEREASIVSVERLDQFTKLPQEGALRAARPLPPRWPAAGALAFEHVRMRYREGLPLVLKGVSFEARAGSKIGVCGRTGSGKSSLLLVLLRAVEVAGGRVTIDGVDVADAGLHDLRERVAIIPQDPVLFQGTLRFNIDPLGAHGDAAVWRALENAHMRPAVEALDGGLDTEVAEGGSNFSVGERQLLCLARALLRDARLLLLDEATSAIDPSTDALVQETIRVGFAHCTTLTIAHRLETIMSSDRVLVMDDGRVVEYGPPAELLSDPDAAFSALVASQTAATGRALH